MMRKNYKSDDELGCGLSVGDGMVTFEYGGHVMFELSFGVVWEMVASGDGLHVVLTPLLSLAMWRLDREVFEINDKREGERIEWFIGQMDKVE